MARAAKVNSFPVSNNYSKEFIFFRVYEYINLYFGE